MTSSFVVSYHRISRGDFRDFGSRHFSGLNPQGGFSDLGQGLVSLVVKSSPGVNPKPRFGPILDSTEGRAPNQTDISADGGPLVEGP